MMWLTIILMALIIFISRYLFLEPKLPLKLSEQALAFLSYSAPAVLTAILTPIVFIVEGELQISLANPYLISAVAAVALALITKNTLLTTVLSMLLFFYLH